MSTPKHETTTLNYAKWLPIYEHEAPYETVGNVSGYYEKTNLEFAPAPVPETIHDIRGKENDYSLDTHAFQLCRQQTRVHDWTNAEEVETQYYAEMEQLLKQELKGVDEIFFYDWRVGQTTIVEMSTTDPSYQATQECSVQGKWRRERWS